MREDEQFPAIDRAVAGHDTIAGDLLFAHAEGLGPVYREGVELGERAWIDEELDPLARGQLPLRVLLVIGIATAMHGVVLSLTQDVDLAFGG